MTNDIRNYIKILESKFTPQFMSWFRGSKVVDNQGNPLMVFRGNRRVPSSTRYILTKNRATPSFVPDPEIASVYARQLDTRNYGKGSNVTPVYLSIKNPFNISMLGEMVELSDIVYMLNHNFEIEYGLNQNMLGYGDLANIIYTMQESIDSVNAHYDIMSSNSSGFVIRDFEELGQIIEEYGNDKDYDSLESVLMDVKFDSYIIGDNLEWVQALKQLGYDGIIHYDVFDVGSSYHPNPQELETGFNNTPIHITYRPFYQNQIKSSVGNIGSYSDDPDITKESM